MENYKTFSQILKAAGITAKQFKEQTKNDESHVIGYKKVTLINKVLNGDWTPHWNDFDETKYVPWFRRRPLGFVYGACYDYYADSYVGSRLCFRSRELAEYAGKTFLKEYKQWLLD